MRKIKLSANIFLVALLIACSGNSQKKTTASHQTNKNETTKMKRLKENQGGNYSVIFLTIHDHEKYNSYREKTEKLMRKSGGHIEREFDVMGQKGNIPDFEAPNRAIVVYWDTPKGSALLMNSKEYQKASELLKASTSNIRVLKGKSAMFQSSDSDETGRMYLMKISYYKENTKGRLNMLHELSPKLAPYGFYTERMIMTDNAVGIETPSEVTIHFHDFASQNEQLQKDESVINGIGKYNEKYLTEFVYLPLMLRKKISY